MGKIYSQILLKNQKNKTDEKKKSFGTDDHFTL